MEYMKRSNLLNVQEQRPAHLEVSVLVELVYLVNQELLKYWRLLITASLDIVMLE